MSRQDFFDEINYFHNANLDYKYKIRLDRKYFEDEWEVHYLSENIRKKTGIHSLYNVNKDRVEFRVCLKRFLPIVKREIKEYFLDKGMKVVVK